MFRGGLEEQASGLPDLQNNPAPILGPASYWTMRFRDKVTIREESESDELGEGGFGAEDDPWNGTGRHGGDSFRTNLTILRRMDMIQDASSRRADRTEVQWRQPVLTWTEVDLGRPKRLSVRPAFMYLFYFLPCSSSCLCGRGNCNDRICTTA